MSDFDDWNKCYKHMLTYRDDWCPMCVAELHRQEKEKLLSKENKNAVVHSSDFEK